MADVTRRTTRASPQSTLHTLKESRPLTQILNSCGWITSPLRGLSRSGDVIHPQLLGIWVWGRYYVVGANGSQVRLGRSSDISVLNGIAPQCLLLLTYFYLLDSRIGHKLPTIFSAKLTKVPWPEMRMNPVIFTVSDPCILLSMVTPGLPRYISRYVV